MSAIHNTFEFVGELHEVRPTRVSAKGFKTREFICKANPGDKFPTYAVFTAKRDDCEFVDTFKVGEKVIVTFFLDGHEWDGPNGKRWFGSATVEAIRRYGESAPTAPEPPEEPTDPEIADDIPF